MKVSRKSWHYRIYCFWRQSWDGRGEGPFMFFKLLARQESLYDYKPKNLCRYFWVVVANTLLSWVVFLVLGAAIMAIIAICYLPYRLLTSAWAERRMEKRKEKKLARRLEIMGEEQRPPGLIVSFLKARKQRVCPLIEVVD